MNAQIINLVEQTVLEKLRAKEAFTALDISNTLKTSRYAVRHGNVATAVRDIYQSGAMAHYDYERRLIDVVTDGGAKKARAFLYLHDETRERDYNKREQSALPLVPTDQARDLSDSVAAGSLPLPPCRTPRASRPRMMCVRRDGALAIPRALVQQLGWSAGMTLALQSESSQLVLRPHPARADTEIRVWDSQRVRVCKTKLRLGALTAEQVTVEIEGDSLRVCLKVPGPEGPG